MSNDTFLLPYIRIRFDFVSMFFSLSVAHPLPYHLVFIKHNQLLGGRTREKESVRRRRKKISSKRWRKEQKVGRFNQSERMRCSVHSRARQKVSCANVNTWKMSLSNNYSLPGSSSFFGTPFHSVQFALPVICEYYIKLNKNINKTNTDTSSARRRRTTTRPTTISEW